MAYICIGLRHSEGFQYVVLLGMWAGGLGKWLSWGHLDARSTMFAGTSKQQVPPLSIPGAPAHLSWYWATTKLHTSG